MRTLGQAIRARRGELRLTLRQLAAACDCAVSYLSLIENDRRERPPSEALLRKLERGLRVEAGTFVELGRWRSTPAEVRAELESRRRRDDAAAQLARMLRAEGVDRAHQSGALRRLVEQIAPAGNVAPTPLPVQVPVINKVQAGYPREFSDLGYPARVADEYVAAPDVMDPQAFAARVVGDSMAPEYAEGDIVVFSPEQGTASGSDCFVRFERDDETTFKRVYFERAGDGRELIRLQPLNSKYAPRVADREQVAGLYAAVYVIRAVGRGGVDGARGA